MKTKISKLLIVASLLAFIAGTAFSIAAHAAPVCAQGASGAAPVATIAWTAPTANTDGTAVSTPITYNLFQSGVSGGEGIVPVATGITTLTKVVNVGLTPATTVYFTVSVVDSKGAQSSQSNEGCKIFPASVPNAVTITITELLDSIFAPLTTLGS